MNFTEGLKNNETVLTGTWIKDNDQVIEDNVCKRIGWLLANYLKKIETGKNGWEILYQDPNDMRYWLLTYPNSDWHGGGPPTLRTLSVTDARAKFKIDEAV